MQKPTTFRLCLLRHGEWVRAGPHQSPQACSINIL